MSTNAATWFYNAPESQAYLISERINGTFWAARVYDLLWMCTQSEELPLRAQAERADGTLLTLTWGPGRWLALSAPEDANVDDLVRALSERILMLKPALTYRDPDGQRVTEWHIDGGDRRWKEIQGVGRYMQPARLN